MSTSTDTPKRTVKSIWLNLTEAEKVDVTYRNFLYWFAKLGLDKRNITDESIQKLEQYCTLRSGSGSYIFKKLEVKKELIGEVFKKCTLDANGVKVIGGKEFQSLLVDKGFVSRTQLYNRATAVGVAFSVSSPISLGDARKIIVGVKS